MPQPSPRPKPQGSGDQAWGPTLLRTFRWGPNCAAPHHSQPSAAIDAPAAARLSVTTLWYQEQQQLAVQVEHPGASEEEILAALEAAAERLRAKIDTAERKAA